MTHLNTHSLSRSECLSLPPEINEHILGFIAADTVDIRYCVLHVCSLVCRAWRRICREAIFQDVLLGSSRQLLCISRTLTPKPGRETKIAIRSIAGWQSESDSPWLHLIPHYLATTAQLYGTEQLDLGGKDTELPLHPSLPIQLSRFRGVRVLHLHGIQFGSFNDLRRVVGVMPSLSEASLTRISWNNLRATSPHPLINATKWGVRDLKMLECQSDPFGIWFWVLHPLRAPSRSYRGLGDAGSHPGLTQEDVYHIIELLEAIPLNSHLQFEWNYQASGYCT